MSYLIVDPEDKERFENLNVGNLLIAVPGQNLELLSGLQIDGVTVPKTNVVLVTPDTNISRILQNMESDTGPERNNFVIIGKELEDPSRLAPTLGLLALVKNYQDKKPVAIVANLIELTRINILGYLQEFRNILRTVLSSA